MAGGEWVVKVTADVKGILDASRQIGQAGKQAGEEYRQGFGDLDKILERMKNQLKEQNESLKGNATTIGDLKSKLSELNQTLDKAAIGSKEFVAAQKEIAATQQKINDALKGFAASEGTINGLRNKMAALNETLGQSVIGSKEFVATQEKIAQTQDKLNSALKGFSGAQNSIEALSNRLAEYNSTLQKAEIGSKEFIAAQKGIAATQKEINNALKGFSGNDQTINGLRSRLSELNQTLDKTAIGSRAFKQTQAEIASTQKQVDQALGKTSAAAGVLGNALNALGFVGVTYGVVGFLKGSIEKAVEMETISRKLSVTLGAQGTAGAMSFARETADRLGLSYKDLLNSFGSFTAAATAAGVPLQVQKDLFGAVAKAGQVLGLTNDEVKGSLNALQQIASKGNVSMEELRQQLGERLPIALAASAKGLGISQDALIKLVETGKLSANDFFPALAKGLNELTESAGGVPTAAQNFTKLQNAWEDLQTSFGTSLLPSVVEGVKGLAAALEGIKAAEAGVELRKSFAFGVDESIQLAAQLEVIQERFGLTNQQAKNLLSNAIANSGASRDWFGQLNTGGEIFGKIQEGLVEEAIKFRNANKDTLGEVNQLAAVEKERIARAKQQNDEKAKELVAQGQLAEAVSNTLKAEVAGRASVQQASVNLGQALIGLEESRFGIIRSRNDYELQEAQKRGASEQELDAIRRQADEIDRAALDFKYKALVQQQELQRSLLALQQEGAALEADLASNNARLEADKARLKLQSAELEGNKQAIAQAELGVQIAELGVESAESKLEILAKTQPIEARIAAANGEAAQNQLKAEAASKGLALAADGTFKAAKNTADQFKTYGNSLKVPLSQQGAFADLAKAVGLQVRDTGKGYFEIGKTLGKDASPAANNIRDYMGTAAKATGAARSQAAGLATNMNNAAGAAQSFYNALAAASGLPDARFTGGPVDAGQTYRINDGPSGLSLGQESFLSASGALSLINRPMNSLWTAPSKGTVIPANVTSRLKESGALGGAGVLRAGPDPAMAHLAAAVGNLSQKVDELNRKAWNVSVGVRGDGSALKLQQTMQRIR